VWTFAHRHPPGAVAAPRPLEVGGPAAEKRGDRESFAMCRFVAYLGQPTYLEELIARPRHSLLRQSLRAEEAKTVTNGDGFGIGWYGERPEPAVYREVMPAWSDDNLLALSGTLRSHLFFAHVRAATSGGIARSNCHPFRWRRWLFMHNGQIGGWSRLRRRLESRLPDALFAERRGATDSELLFLLIAAHLARGAPATDAVMDVYDEVCAHMRAEGIAEPLRFAAALADGQQLHAFRLASDGAPPTLYRRDGEQGSVIASEPLDEAASGWQAIAPGSVVTLECPCPTTRAADQTTGASNDLSRQRVTGLSGCLA
jgi:predicted glutamine amidotransferase